MTTQAWRETWERLYRQAYPDIYRALVATLFDADLAADALHDAFVQGIQRPPPHDENLRGWVYRVALRSARRARLRSRLLAPIGAIFGPAEQRAGRAAEDVLDRLTVGQLLKLLTERQRAVVVAYFYLGLRQEDIAERMGIRRGTVAATLAHAIERMRKGESRVI